MDVEHIHAHDHGHAGGTGVAPVGAPHAPLGPLSDPAQEALVQALRASFNILRVVMVVLVALYLLSGVFRVEPGEQGLVARLGKLRTIASERGETSVFTQGWYWSLPDPFDKKYVVPGKPQELSVATFLFNNPQAETSQDLSELVAQSTSLTPGLDGAMFTGDRNLSHGRWEVQYQIRAADLFVQNVGAAPADFKPLLRRLTETAVVREIAGRTVEQVTRTALEAVRDGVKQRLQAALDELQTGVQVAQVVAFTIEPGAVRPAFLEVVRAENERLRLQDEAREAESEILNRAAGDKYAQLIELINAYGDAQLRGADQAELDQRLAAVDAVLDEAKRDGAGQVAVKLAEAEAQADQINQKVRREYEEFQKYVEQRRIQPDITLLGLWVQMRREILGSKQNEIVFVPDQQEIEIHVKSDPQRKAELFEEERTARTRGEKGRK
jgi:membrane protease subunit HflK